MRKIYPLVAALFALTAFASMAAAQGKTDPDPKGWTPLPANVIFADVAEVEPNGSLATAQALGCDNVLRPASVAAAADTDYVSFYAVAGTKVTIGTDADGTTGQLTDTRIRLFNDSGVVLTSDDDSGPGAYSLISSFTLPYTGTYYVGFAAYSATASGIYKGFITCVVPQPPPANDNCGGAIAIGCGPIALQGDNTFATNDYTPLATGTGGCTGYTAMGRDVVYMINAAPGDSLRVTYTNAADGSIYLITDCASPTTSCVKGADATFTGQAETLGYTFTTGGIYYLILDSYGTDTGGAWTMTGELICPVVPTARKSWGQIKTIYR